MAFRKAEGFAISLVLCLAQADTSESSHKLSVSDGLYYVGELQQQRKLSQREKLRALRDYLNEPVVL